MKNMKRYYQGDFQNKRTTAIDTQLKRRIIVERCAKFYIIGD